MISFTFLDESIGKKKHPIPFAYEDISVSLVGVTVLTKSNVRKCVGALINFENGPFRTRHDGGLPVDNVLIASASGYLRSSGDEYFFSREEALRLVIILSPVSGAVDGMLRVTYYGQ
jgi:hypothetical protein